MLELLQHTKKIRANKLTEPLKIGLALSGGGSRAIAFHLGCLRALNDHAILEKVTALSSVSGGSVIAAMYAYYDDSFEEFDARVCALLKKGFMGGIARQTMLSLETPKIVYSQLTASMLARLGVVLNLVGKVAILIGFNRSLVRNLLRPFQAPMRRRASRTTAFERYLRKNVFGDARLDAVKRPNLQTVINAAEMRTGTAFRYGSKESGSWRFGVLTGKPTYVSKAVAASAAFPALLPAFDDQLEFEKDGEKSSHRVIITDGGVYDNLGFTPFLPGRSSAYSSNVFDVDYIISCDAGIGQAVGSDRPYSWASRMLSTISTIHRRTSVLSYGMLHQLTESGKLKGFLLPYLGQQDSSLPYFPDDLIKREHVMNYPTDFSKMSDHDLHLLSLRGEQLTKLLIEHYKPEVV